MQDMDVNMSLSLSTNARQKEKENTAVDTHFFFLHFLRAVSGQRPGGRWQ